MLAQKVNFMKMKLENVKNALIHVICAGIMLLNVFYANKDFSFKTINAKNVDLDA